MDKYNQRGLIPGPQETKESFLGRCAKAKRFAPLSLFDLAPDWVEVVYSNQGLHFWEGGCMWIDEEGQATFQLKEAFLKREWYLGIYSREEIIQHELVHMVRQRFEEPLFEEILAYQTAPSPFRRFWGPFFRTSREAQVFLGILAATVLLSLFSPWAFSLLGVVLAVGSYRLIRLQRIFRRARRQIERLVGKERALSFLLHLTDQEIIQFSRSSREEIKQFITQQTTIRHLQLQQYL